MKVVRVPRNEINWNCTISDRS